MMVLADLDLFLIRATHTDSQTSTRWGREFFNYCIYSDTMTSPLEWPLQLMASPIHPPQYFLGGI